MRHGRPPRALEPRSARDAIGAALAFRGITDQIRAQRVIEEWSDLVGPKIASRTRPDGVYERVLVVEVASSAWLHELTLLKAPILAGLVERLGAPQLFDDLKFRLTGRGRPSARATRTASGRSRPAPRQLPPPATGLAREQIVREADAVDDLELRELIARVRIAADR